MTEDEIAETGRAKRRVQQAIDEILHPALLRYMKALPNTGKQAYKGADALGLLKAFIDRFPTLPYSMPREARQHAYEVRAARNEVSHYAPEKFSPPDALAYLHSVRRFLRDIAAKTEAERVDQLYGEQFAALNRRAEPPASATPAKAAPPLIGRRSDPSSLLGRPARVFGKYRSLQDHLSARTDHEWHASFREVEAVLGTSLPKSARSHPAWWSNSTSHSHAHAWLGAGWRTSNLNITGETVSFVRSPATGIQ